MNEPENKNPQSPQANEAPQSIEEAAAQTVASGDPLPPPQQNFAEKCPSEIAPEPAEMTPPELIAAFKYLRADFDALSARVDALCTQLNVKS